MGADGSARDRSSSSDGLEDPDDEEEEEEDAKSQSRKELELLDDDEEEEDEEEAEEELEDVEGLLLARFLARRVGGLVARTSSTPATVNRYSLPAPSS